MNNKPSFLNFLIKSYSNRKVYKNNKTGREYMEENSYRTRKILEYIIFSTSIVLLLVSWLLDIADKFNILLIVVQLLVVFLIVFLVYPLRFFTVKFTEVNKNDDIINTKFRKEELFLVIAYLISRTLVWFIIMTFFW